MTGRLARHRSEIRQFGLAGWWRRNLFWVLGDMLGLRILRVALLPLEKATEVPAPAFALQHRLVDRDTALAVAALPEMRLDPAVVAARFARGDLCLMTFHGEQAVAYNWYATSSAGSPGDFAITFPPAFIMSHDTFVHPDWRGRGVASDSWQVSREIFLARGATHILSWVDSGNIASIRAVSKNEHTLWIGRVALWRGLGRRAAFVSAGCRRRGIGVAVR